MQYLTRSTDDPSLFFRSNDLVTSMVVSYAKLGSFEWLQDFLSPILETAGANVTFEFDEEGNVAPSHEAMFCAVMDEVFDYIASAVSSCPVYFRYHLAVFRNVVASRFPDALSHVAAFFFLRIICPALVSPADFGFLIGRYNRPVLFLC